MVALPCMYLKDDAEIDDCRICRGYEVNGAEKTVHVIGGFYTSDWAIRNRIAVLNCRGCQRFHTEIEKKTLAG